MKSCAKIHKFGERLMLSTCDYIITIASYKTIHMRENTVFRNNYRNFINLLKLCMSLIIQVILFEIV